jgi:hypothetical protein
MSNADDGSLGPTSQEPPTTPEPQVQAVKRDDTVWRMDKREVLKTAVVGTVAAVIGGCSSSKDDDDLPDAVPPFSVGGTTYRLIELPSYNAKLPAKGKNLAVVAFKDSDFYFRSFDARGKQEFFDHESKVQDQAALGELKKVVQSVTANRIVQPTEQDQIAELFTATTRPAGSTGGRRMQGSQTEAERPGRRMQGSSSTGAVSVRRMQGAEGRLEGSSAQRNLGTLKVNEVSYEESKIVETYTDGYTKVAHSGGEVVVRTDALPEIVRMQLPHAIVNPSPKPSAVPSTGSTTSSSGSSSRSSSSSSGGSYRSSGGHYWRPN